MSKIYESIKECKFFATGTCADIYITKDDKIVKVVELNNKHEFESKKLAIMSCYAEHELINLIGTYKSYGVYISKKHGYITMDKVPGKSLHEIFDNDLFKFIDADDALSVIKDWTKQLIQLHEVGVCHYSLHKSNLFMNNNKGYIIDFGNAVLDKDYENDYKFLRTSTKMKNNYRRIFTVQNDFYFYIKNVQKFIQNVESVKDSIQFKKLKRLNKYIHYKKKELKEKEFSKKNHAIDLYSFMLNLDNMKLKERSCDDTTDFM